MRDSILSQDNYIPERLYFNNLFSCCCCTPNELHTAINDQIVKDINEEMSLLEKSIKKYSRHEGGSLLPHHFISEANKLEKILSNLSSNNCKGRYKLPDYCLIKYYNIIKRTNFIIEKGNGNLSDVPSNQKKDIEIFENFSRCMQQLTSDLDAGAISEKNLQRFLKPCGIPYKNNQPGLILYTLKNVFPRFINSNGNTFSESIKNINWKDIIYKDIEKNEQKIYLDEKSHSFSEIEAYFEEQFNKLIHTPEDNFKEIGNILVELYEKLVDLYKNDFLSSQQNPNPRETDVNIEISDKNTSMTEYDSILSSHILEFMRWLPMISSPPYQPELLQCIESVIDKIRNYIIDNDDLKNKMLSNHQDNLFIGNSNVDLRKKLIFALHNDVYIHSCFHS